MIARTLMRHYDSGHFNIYRGDLFESAVADQIEFLLSFPTLSSLH
ncbi:hypothetical protein [Rhodococcus sp. (in: high G+C Gram-positive bacteria)]|nr:hypothetical protein [Rhodococcus sp. (in: high G+C Gram-positive bacteria)]